MGRGRGRATVAVAVCLGLLASLPAAAPSTAAPAPTTTVTTPRWGPVTLATDPGAHPYLLAGTSDLDAIRVRIDAVPAAGEAWRRLVDWADRLASDGTDALDPGDVAAYRVTGRAIGGPVQALAFVWLLTRDTRYLDRLSAVWQAIERAPFHAMPFLFDFQEWYNERAVALTELSLAYDWTAADLDPAARAAAVDSLTQIASTHFGSGFGAWWWRLRAGSNFSGNNGAAIGMAALALRAELPAATTDAWLGFSLTSVGNYFANGFGRDGEAYEGILYGNFGMQNPTFLGEALARMGGPAILDDPALAGHRRWSLSQLLPGGARVNPLNDARYTEQSGEYATWRTSHGPDQALAGWFWQNYWYPRTDDIGDPIPTVLWFSPPPEDFDPDATVAHTQVFADDGLVAARTGYEADDFYSSVQARGSRWGTNGVHYNQDVTHFTLYADGADFAVDSGYANGLLTCGVFRCNASKTQAHNAVTIDGISQNTFVTWGSLPRVATTSVPGDDGSLDLSVADARTAWLAFWRPRIATRRHLVVRPGDGVPAYLVVADSYDRPGTHEYEWWLHTAPANTPGTPAVVPGGLDWSVDAPGGARMRVALASPQPVTSATTGLWRTDYPALDNHPYMRAAAQSPAGFRSVAALVPIAPGGAEPTITRSPDGSAVVLAWPGGVSDTATLTPEGFSFVRTGGGSPRIAVDGTGGVDGLASLDGLAALVTSDHAVAVSGDSAHGAVHATGFDSVVVNGAAVAFTTDDDGWTRW